MAQLTRPGFARQNKPNNNSMRRYAIAAALVIVSVLSVIVSIPPVLAKPSQPNAAVTIHTTQNTAYPLGTKTATPRHSPTPTPPPIHHNSQIIPPGGGSTFVFPSFTADDLGTSLFVNSSAQLGPNGSLRITPAQHNLAGSFWYATPQLIGDGFETTFQVLFTGQDTSGVAGMVWPFWYKTTPMG